MNRRIEPARQDELRGEYEDVRRAYAELGDEPVPPDLDARVLDRARAAVRPARARPRWLVPASLAASVVFALGVALDVRHEANERPAAENTVVSGEVAASGGAVAATAESADASAAVVDAPDASAAAADASAAKQRPAREHAASNASEKRAAASADRPAVPARAAAPHPPSLSERVAAAPTVAAAARAEAAAPAARESAIVQARPAPATARAPSISESADAAGTASLVVPASPALAPEEWLANIEALRRAGRTAEADAELVSFRRTYPDYLPATAPR